MGAVQLSLFEWLMPSHAKRLPPSEAEPAPAESVVTVAHPLANRCIEHQGARLHYYLRRTQRRTIGLQVGADGLVVSAPRWALVSDITQAVIERTPWVLQKMREMRQRDEAHLRQQIHWVDGASIPYLGQNIRVQLDPQVVKEGLVTNQAAFPESGGEGSGSVLKLRIQPDASGTQIREKVQAWLVQQAVELFAQRLNHFAPQLGVSWKRLRLSQARTRWGSANSQGTICLNWRLIHHTSAIIDYVVVHELSHLRVMNHSPAFWGTVASVMPGYSEHRAALKKEILPPW